MSGAVSILMYHGIGRVLGDWRWSDLTAPWETFEDHLRAMRRAGYRSATLHEWHRHASGAERLPERTVVLTFDDGYLDNWVYAAPLLERHGFTATVLVTPEFVPPGDAVRPTLRDAWEGRASSEDLPVRGFMSWEELRRLAAGGVIDVQCHAMTHTWYETGDDVTDFHHPGDPYYWLGWNARPETKPYYLENPRASEVPFGVPVYRHERSLACRRYFPDAAEGEYLAGWIAARGGESYFAQPGWREPLRAELARYRLSRPPRGRAESDDEYRARLEYEIVESKRVIERNVGCPVDFLVWPAGGYNDDAMALARRHYAAVTISSAERHRLRNRPGENPGSIVRRGAPELPVRGGSVYAPGDYLVDFLDEYRGSTWARRRRQVRKLAHLVKARTAGS